MRKTVSLLGAVSYFAVASLALILVSRDSCTCAGQFDNLREGIGSDVKAAINSDWGVTIKSKVMGSPGLATEPKTVEDP